MNRKQGSTALANRIVPTRRATIAIGAAGRNGNGRPHVSPKVAVCFDPDMFVRIQQMAVRRKIAFAAQVRQLCELGLEAFDE